jgi:hypothetical protein
MGHAVRIEYHGNQVHQVGIDMYKDMDIYISFWQSRPVLTSLFHALGVAISQ